jgi:nucleotide-binding universal stress UspA family protein
MAATGPSMFRKALAAVDSSPRAPAVLECALELAERFDGVVHLFRAVTLPAEFPAAARTEPDDLPERLRQQALEELQALAAGRPRVVVEPPELGAREPWRVILETAQRLGADAIVIGSHGYAGWDRVLGTTASKVANHADRAVLVVHPPRGGAGPGAPGAR